MNSLYFVALVLPPQLNERILAYKKWMAEKFGCKVGLKSPAHITLVSPFWMEVEKEEALKSEIGLLASYSAPFIVVTNSFSAFKPRTLFVAVHENETLLEMKRRADNHFGSADYKIRKESRPFHPHITIATRDLQKNHFAEAWAHFEGKRFEEEFEAKALSLLKHNGKAWDVIYEAPLRR